MCKINGNSTENFLQKLIFLTLQNSVFFFYSSMNFWQNSKQINKWMTLNFIYSIWILIGDWLSIFKGNTDETFRIGISLARKSINLYTVWQNQNTHSYSLFHWYIWSVILVSHKFDRHMKCFLRIFTVQISSLHHHSVWNLQFKSIAVWNFFPYIISQSTVKVIFVFYTFRGQLRFLIVIGSCDCWSSWCISHAKLGTFSLAFRTFQ